MKTPVNASPPTTASARKLAVSVRGLHKRFDTQVALERIDLDVYTGEFMSLLGPSGCGKTTLLRIIAGFEQPDAGEVVIGGQDALGLPPFRRPVNTVFQSYALFPHMTVMQNVMFGLRMARVPRAEAEERALEAMRLVEIASFGKRKPDQLSGGQRQRVALARAIVNEPEVLLLDEPLGALDLKLRKQLQVELMQLQQRLGMTFIYVTHDQEEALVMSDRVAVMRSGLIAQLGGVAEVYERPLSRYVATFLGSSNLIEGHAREVHDATATLDTPLGPLHSSAGRYRVGQTITVSVRPEKIFVARSAEGFNSANTLQGRVEELVYTGVENQYLIRVGATLLSAYAMNKSLAEHDTFRIGDDALLVIPFQSVVPLQD
jgi:spermidine/putrescine transport system ATP-binding protein